MAPRFLFAELTHLLRNHTLSQYSVLPFCFYHFYPVNMSLMTNLENHDTCPTYRQLLEKRNKYTEPIPEQ